MNGPAQTDPNSQTIKLCIGGTQAEYAGRVDEARRLYQAAWDAARDDYESCVAAHYVARLAGAPQECLRWNQAALAHADAVGDERVRVFYPSLYLALGRSYEQTGQPEEAQRCYALAAALGFPHQMGLP